MSGLEIAPTVKREIIYIAISELKPGQKELRVTNRRHRRALEASLKRYGFTVPVIIDSERNILAGRRRVEAAKAVGMTAVPTICLDGLTPAQKRTYIIADNRIAELSGWDREVLRVELQEIELEFPEINIEDTAFSVAEIDLLELEGLERPKDEDLIPEDTAGPAVTKPGEIWQLGRHRIICADALDPQIYEQLLDGKVAQMVFTDPPYNVKIKGHVSGKGRVIHREFAMASGEMSDDAFATFLKTAFANVARRTIDGAIVYICIDWRHVADLLGVTAEVFTQLKNICVWNKSNAGMGTFYRSKHEFIVVCKNGTAPHINNFGLGDTGRSRTNVWDYPGMTAITRERLDELAIHPTVKPVALVADAIRDCSKRGGVILDPFLGSGTTVIAAELTGRKAYGIELDPLYVDTVIRRWQRLTGEQALLAGSGQTFDRLVDERGHSNEQP